MSNVLQLAFYLPRPTEPACRGNSPRDGQRRSRTRCGASRGQQLRSGASLALAAEWLPPSLAAHYPPLGRLGPNVSSGAAEPAPFLRPAQTSAGRETAPARQQR